MADTATVDAPEAVVDAGDPVPEAKAESAVLDPMSDRARKVLDKEPSSLHKHYVDWLTEKTGWVPETVDRSDYEKIVQLAVSLYQGYQASPERARAREDERRAKMAAQAEKLQEREAAKAKKAAEKAAALEAKKKAEEAAAAAAVAEAEAAGEGSDAPPARKAAPRKKSAPKASAGEAPF